MSGKSVNINNLFSHYLFIPGSLKNRMPHHGLCQIVLTTYLGYTLGTYFAENGD